MRTSARPFGIVAHRGRSAGMRDNTPEAFRRALALGADAVELDVRLSRDRVPLVHHDWYLDASAGDPLPIFAVDSAAVALPRLKDVVDEFAGRLGLEIELKDPAIDTALVVADLLAAVPAAWEHIEATSFDPTLLRVLSERCPGVGTALLFPASEPWMRSDVVAYAALHRAQGCGAAAVHLAANQLTAEVVAAIQRGGVDVHAHSVDDDEALRLARTVGVSWICTDEVERALAFRRRVAPGG